MYQKISWVLSWLYGQFMCFFNLFILSTYPQTWKQVSKVNYLKIFLTMLAKENVYTSWILHSFVYKIQISYIDNFYIVRNIKHSYINRDVLFMFLNIYLTPTFSLIISINKMLKMYIVLICI